MDTFKIRPDACAVCAKTFEAMVDNIEQGGHGREGLQKLSAEVEAFLFANLAVEGYEADADAEDEEDAEADAEAEAAAIA